MKRSMIIIAAIAAMLAGLVAHAEEQPAKDREAMRAELREAREQLAEAARRVGELTRELGEDRFFVFNEDFQGGGDRAMLGVVIGVVDGDDGNGVKVMSVTPGGPADKAGIQAGDVIRKIDDVKLGKGDAGKLTGYLADRKPGDEVKLTYLRGKDERTATVKTEALSQRVFMRRLGGLDGMMPHTPELPGLPEMPRRPFMFDVILERVGDMELVSITPDLGEYFGVKEGLLVVRAPENEAFKLKDGDVIMKIGGRTPEDPGHAMRILRSYQGGENLELEIVRQKKRQTLKIEMPERELGMHWKGRGPEGEEREIIVAPAPR